MANEIITVNTPGEFDALKALVIDGLNSPHSKTMYAFAIDDFMAWYQTQGKPGLTRRAVNAYKSHLQSSTDYAPSTINQRLSAIRKLAREAHYNEFISAEQYNSIKEVKGMPARGVRTGNWLTLDQAQKLIDAPDLTRLKGIRDRAILAIMIGAGLRRSEVVKLQLEDLQQRDGRWVIPDLMGKGGRVRTVPLPNWAKQAIDEWITAANLTDGYVFRPINKGDSLSGDSMTSQAVQNTVKEYADLCGYTLSAHDLRRTFAQLARKANAPIDQIQLTLGHASVQTTERYLGTKQDLTSAPCDLINLKLDY